METPIELRHLACFISAVECNSISHAALVHDVSQPTFSTRIRQLESMLGVHLFHRNGRGVVATPAALAFYERIKPLIAGLNTAMVEVAARDGMHHGEVVVGIVPSVAARLSIPLVGESDPHFRVRVVESFSGHLHQWLLQGDIDVAVCTALPKQKRIRQTLIGREALHLVGQRGGGKMTGSVPFRSVEGVPLVLGSAVHSIRQILNKTAERLRIKLRVEYEIDSLDAQLRLVRQGMGYAVLPAAALNAAETSGLQTWPIVDPQIHRHVVVATRPHILQTKPMTASVVATIVRIFSGDDSSFG
jgi:LysR family nitrogen assimilation transcriptional regulator